MSKGKMSSKNRYAPRAVAALALAVLLAVGGVAGAETGHSGILVVNADGSGRTRLTTNPSGDWLPAWSPDGTKIAYTHSGAIHVMNSDGSDSRPLTNPVPGGLDAEPSWSPDGTTIAFSRLSGGQIDVFAMNADGSSLRSLTNAPGRDSSPTWSPDGAKIAFVSNRGGILDIYVMNADGTDQRPIAGSPLVGSEPDWSPDGTTIAFSKGVGPPTYGYDIALIGADGAGERRLTNDINFDYSPAWSPDGKKIAFSRSAGIFVVDVDSGNVHPLTTVSGDEAPAWSPDGTRLAFQWRPPPPPPGIPPPPPPPPPPPRPAARCIVPRVVGLRLSRAQRKLRRARCKVGSVRKRRSARAGIVLAQKPRARAIRRRGFAVRLVVGRR
jgi:Tol biopolymer transport system component